MAPAPGGPDEIVTRTGRRIFGAGLALASIAAATLALGAAWRIERRDGPTPALPPELALDQIALPDGTHLAYRKYAARGTGAGTPAPIVVLHGGPGVPPLRSSFDYYGRLAETGHAVYVYEQIGVGQSSRLDDIRHYTLQRDIDDLDALRTAIGAARIILIGQSWGAVLAIHYRAQHPDAVDRAVLISPAAFRHGDRFQDDDGRTAAAEHGGSIHPPLALVLAGLLARMSPASAQIVADQAALGRAYDAFWADPASADKFYCRGARPPAALFQRDRGANYYALLMTLASAQRVADPAPALRGTETPTLILRGTCDFIPRAVAEDYVAALPDARILDIAGAGHMAPDAKPAEVLAAIQDFLTAPETAAR